MIKILKNLQALDINIKEMVTTQLVGILGIMIEDKAVYLRVSR